MLAHPRATLAETAFYFNVSISWVSILKNSDAFQELWARRRGEHFHRVSATVTERVQALADVTIDALTEKVEQEVRAGTANIGTLKEVGDMALKSLGFGPKGNTPAGGPAVQNNFFIDKETLARAREARARMQVIDNEARVKHAALLDKPVVEHE